MGVLVITLARDLVDRKGNSYHPINKSCLFFYLLKMFFKVIKKKVEKEKGIRFGSIRFRMAGQCGS